MRKRSKLARWIGWGIWAVVWIWLLRAEPFILLVAEALAWLVVGVVLYMILYREEKGIR